jgi:hypothetical protein
MKPPRTPGKKPTPRKAHTHRRRDSGKLPALARHALIPEGIWQALRQNPTPLIIGKKPLP